MGVSPLDVEIDPGMDMFKMVNSNELRKYAGLELTWRLTQAWTCSRVARGQVNRALIEAYAVEPLVGDAGVQACALLLARPGDSVYRCFVDTVKDRRGRPVYHCRACAF